MTQISHIFTPGVLVTYVLLTLVIDVPEYIAANGQSPYARWFNGLNAQAAAKLAIAVTRMAEGNFSNAKSIGAALHE